MRICNWPQKNAKWYIAEDELHRTAGGLAWSFADAIRRIRRRTGSRKFAIQSIREENSRLYLHI